MKFVTRDVVQVIVGATILAIPVAFTQEIWELGGKLPLINILGILLFSLCFIAIFTYYHYYRNKLLKYFKVFLKRVFFTYLIAFLVVGVLLTLIQKTPWSTDFLLAIKRIVLVSLPSSMSAAIADKVI